MSSFLRVVLLASLIALAVAPAPISRRQTSLRTSLSQVKASIACANIKESNGLSGDTCKTSGDCKGDRQCLLKNTIDRSCSGAGSSQGCQCQPGDKKVCSSNGDCEGGEVCAVSNQSSQPPVCLSECFVEQSGRYDPVGASANTPRVSPSAEISSATCIAVHSLTHLPRRSLVFKTDPVAHVLCDAQQSCATPGHMVHFKGRAMMMASYCNLVPCAQRQMRVNSPRYSRAARLNSQTEGLQFTALAARYETVTEERILAAAVRMGL